MSLTSGGVPSGVLTPAEVLTLGHVRAPSVAAQAAGPARRVRGGRAGSGAGFARGGTAIVDVLPSAESTLPAGQAEIAVGRARAGRHARASPGSAATARR